MENTNDNAPSQIVETPEFLANVVQALDIQHWDDLRQEVDYVASSRSFYTGMRPRNDGLRYIHVGHYAIGCDTAGYGSPVVYRRFI